jgi:hypothetical protein
MTDDVILGARYNDSVFDSDFTVTAVEVDDDVPPDERPTEEQVWVELTYEHGFDEPVTITLAQFRREDGHELREVPPHTDQ